MIHRIALTQTVNAYRDMPASRDDLGSLAGRLEAVREANLDHHERLLVRAAERGAKLVSLGELFAAPYFALDQLPMWHALAEDAQRGPTVTRMRALARKHHVIVSAPIYELDPHSGKRFNTAVLIDERGELLGSYRKSHIPQGTNERATFSERFYYGPSDGEMFVEAAHNVSPHRFFPVYKTSVGRVGICICYDRHFDGVVRTLSDGGAQLVLCPAVTFGQKSERMWRAESATDAARHRVFIACSNRRGAEQPWGVEYFGDSHVMSPEGPLDNKSDHPELVICDADLDALGDLDSSGWRLDADRRRDIYAH